MENEYTILKSTLAGTFYFFIVICFLWITQLLLIVDREFFLKEVMV